LTKTKKPIKQIAAIRANLKRYGGFSLKEWPHPERDNCCLFTITNSKADNLIHCELVYCPDSGWELKKSKYTHKETDAWLRRLIYNTLQGRFSGKDK
jgi:hypothetical protein